MKPLLSPPLTADTLDPAQFEGFSFIYFKLHGLPDQPYWYGEGWTTAITAEQVASIDLRHTTVFVANCHLWQQPTEQNAPYVRAPMLMALLAAGAKAIVGGPGENYAKRSKIHSADELGLYFRRLITMKFPPSIAFYFAMETFKTKNKRSLKQTAKQIAAIQDTVQFHLFERETLNPKEPND